MISSVFSASSAVTNNFFAQSILPSAKNAKILGVAFVIFAVIAALYYFFSKPSDDPTIPRQPIVMAPMNFLNSNERLLYTDSASV